MQTWALCGAVALAGLLGAGQALAASSPPFVDNDDGTVTDTSTGLMWDQCMDGLSGNGNCLSGALVTYAWGDAVGRAAAQSAANYKGYSDWRLPSVVELGTLLKGTISPRIDTAAFPATPPGNVWSASTYAPLPSDAWVVDFDGGSSEVRYEALTFFVRLVRSGQYFGSFGLFPVGVSGITASAATLTTTSPVLATGYWLVVPRAATPPTPTQVMLGVSYGSVTVAVGAAGTDTMEAKSATSFSATGLVAGTHYDAYIVATESTYSTRTGLVGPVPFSTLTIATSAIVIDPATPTTLYAGLDGRGVYRSTDSSATWSAINTDLTNLNVRALAIQNSSTLFAATYDGGVFKGSLSAGNWSWAACGTGLPGSARLRSLIVDSAGNLYAGSETGVFKNTSACVAWTAQNTGMP